MRIGVVGCGQWGRNHARTLNRLGVLGGVADLHTERAEAVAAATFTTAMSVDRLLREPGIDGVVIALPPSLHASHALRAISEGKHVLIEKPMALDVKDAADIAAHAAAKRVVAMTGHILLFHPAFEAIESMAAAGRLGALRRIETVRIGLGRSHPGTNAVMDLLPHDLSMILALANSQPEGAALVRSEFSTPIGAEPAELRLFFQGGLTTQSRASNSSPLRERRLTLRCDAGLLVFDDIQPWERKLAFLRANATVETEPTYIKLPEREPLAAELQHFVSGIEGVPVSRSSVADGLRVLRILALCAGHKESVRDIRGRMAALPERRPE